MRHSSSLHSRFLVCLLFVLATSVVAAGDAAPSAAPWDGAHRDQVTAVLGEPNKSKCKGDGSERLTYRLLRLPPGSLPAPNQRLVQVPGLGACVTLAPIEDPATRESVEFEPTSIDKQGRPIAGGVSRSQSRSVTLGKDGQIAGLEGPESRAGEGKVKLRLYLDANGYVTSWTVSPKPH